MVVVVGHAAQLAQNCIEKRAVAHVDGMSVKHKTMCDCSAIRCDDYVLIRCKQILLVDLIENPFLAAVHDLDKSK